MMEITTLGDVIYMNVKNDISFIIDEEMTLWEHQSTFNPNMPVRGLVYFSRLYQKYISERNLNVYGPRPIRLPKPRFVVFYIGEAERPDREVLKLSDLLGDGDPDVEVRATMVNINAGKSPEVLSACKALSGYSTLVARARGKIAAGYQLEEAVSRAVDECIGDGILEEHLISKKSEVISMFMTEYDEDKVREMFREDGRAEGLAEGLAEGMAEGLAEGMAEGMAEGQRAERERTLASVAVLVREGALQLQAAASGFGFTEAEIRTAM